MREVAAAHPLVHFHWIDIEDEADALGDVDIETFPTLLVTAASEPLFFGPVEPSRAQLERLLQRLQGEDTADGHAADPSTQALALRLAPLLRTAVL